MRRCLASLMVSSEVEGRLLDYAELFCWELSSEVKKNEPF